jgi:MFS family permease
MLFSTFEAWYVYEHSEHYGFPSEWMGVTFSKTTFWNGLLAIFAGVLSNFVAETMGYGPVAPFALACIPLMICGGIVTTSWPENFGDRKLHFRASCHQGLREIKHDKKILLLGLLQTIVESVMYIFVFLWTPVLMPAQPPLGMVFACFMVAIMIGSSVFSLLLSKGFRAEETLRIILVILALSMGICCVMASPNRNTNDMVIIYAAFLILEVAIGMYFPAMSYLKSQIIPEGHRANVMNWFRVPMNVITCAALMSLNLEFFAHDKRIMFGICFILCLIGLLFQRSFKKLLAESKTGNSDHRTETVKLINDDSDDA